MIDFIDQNPYRAFEIALPYRAGISLTFDKKMEHDFDRPFRDQSSMETFRAINKRDARRFGPIVKAMTITNREYSHRFSRLAKENNMKDPPGSATHIMIGHLVVRRLGTDRQYETWMPSDVFEELYEKSQSNSQASK